MQISPEKIREIAKLYEAYTRHRTVGARSSPRLRPDRVDLSSEAQVIQAAMRAIKAAPDVRQQKVDELRARIERGEYFVPAEKLAERMLRGQ